MGGPSVQEVNQKGAGVREKSWIEAFSRLVERLVPDAITTSAILLIVVATISL